MGKAAANVYIFEKYCTTRIKKVSKVFGHLLCLHSAKTHCQ